MQGDYKMDIENIYNLIYSNLSRVSFRLQVRGVPTGNKENQTDLVPVGVMEL